MQIRDELHIFGIAFRDDQDIGAAGQIRRTVNKL
jgi:hypothetical protein